MIDEKIESLLFDIVKLSDGANNLAENMELHSGLKPIFDGAGSEVYRVMDNYKELANNTIAMGVVLENLDTKLSALFEALGL